MKVAIVHDYLMQDGGAEKVLEALIEIFPDSPIYVLFYNKEKVNSIFTEKKVITSFLQHLPFAKHKYQWYLPLMPAATEHYDLRDFDIVISSTSAFAKGIITRPDTLHICYCHTPTRYLWTDTHDYIRDLNLFSFIKKLLPIHLNKLRTWDFIASQRVDHYIANSKTVQQRIQKYYNRTSDIIHPPIEIEKFSVAKQPRDYFLTGGRLVPYKRYDITIQACNKLNLPLKIFGTGPAEQSLRKIAGPTIEFLGRVSDSHREDLYKHALAFINPQEEDLGLTPLESMASGRPVIAYNRGGATETVIDGTTGIFFDEQTAESLIDAIKRSESMNFNSDTIRNHALTYSKASFKNKIKNYIEAHWNNKDKS